MKRNVLLLLVIALVLSVFVVACKAEIEAPTEELVNVSFAEDASRALSATLEEFDPDDYFWKYAAAKNAGDASGLTSGATAGYNSDEEGAREAGAQWIHEGVAGLSGTVPGFSQGLWDFTLYAYKNVGTSEEPVYSLSYLGEVTGVTLVKGGTNMVHVVVSPAPEGNGTLYIGETSLTPNKEGDQPSVSRSLKVEDLEGQEYYPTTGTTYELAAGAYKVTVTYKTSGIVYAEGTVIATIYPNMTTTVTGSVDELVTYAQFEAEQNPDIIARTAEVTGIMKEQIVPTGSYTLEDTAASQTVAPVVTATIPKAAAQALIDSTDPNAVMSLALNVDTTDSTSTSVTYDISMSKTVTVASESTTSNVEAVEDWVTVEIVLRSGLTGVAVTHSGTPMAEKTSMSELIASTVEAFFYDSAAGKLYIKTMTFSPFAVSYDAIVYVAKNDTKNLWYNDLQTAIDEASAGDTIVLVQDIALTKYISIVRDVTIEGENHIISTTASRGLRIQADDVRLVLRNLTIDGNSTSERCVQVDTGAETDFYDANITIENCNLINFTYYTINFCSHTTVNLLVKDSYVSGWAAINAYGTGNTIEVIGSILEGKNDKSPNAWNTFATICLEGDSTGHTTDHSSDYQVTVTGSKIIASQSTGNKQYILGFNDQSVNSTVVFTDCVFEVGEGCYFCYNNGTGHTLIIDDQYIIQPEVAEIE